MVTVSAALTFDRLTGGGYWTIGGLCFDACAASLLYLAGWYFLKGLADSVLTPLRCAAGLALWLAVTGVATHAVGIRPQTVAVHSAATVAFLMGIRVFGHRVAIRLGLVTRLLIVGTGPTAVRVAQDALRHDPLGNVVLGFVGLSPTTIATAAGGPMPPIRVVAPEALRAFLRRQRVHRVVLAPDPPELDATVAGEVITLCRRAGCPIETVETFAERLSGRVRSENADLEGLRRPGAPWCSALTRAAKRLLDLTAAIVLLVVGAPVCALVALAIAFEDRGPIFFAQNRVGRGGTRFTLRKLRSMVPNAEADTGPRWATLDDPRVTRVGRWIRPLHIDELPQAWNILKGEMSLIGPRPERPEFEAVLKAAVPNYELRHLLRPGITGWAQINLPSSVSIEDARRKLEFDFYYIKHFSLLMDAQILLRTLRSLLFGWEQRWPAPSSTRIARPARTGLDLGGPVRP